MLPAELLEIIPRYKTGPRKGRSRSERFRHIEVLLQRYKFNEAEVEFFKREIDEYNRRRLQRFELLKKARQERDRLLKKM